ncbi:hypothetical protein F2Q68_00041771 [Brassica cretica]|uniref:Protein kinase domain-containing protein n=1 Tax=Brassica cretica TaxID=69181 RepID=A0A8S9MS67_BRACR|nr:hypothetical protein F2Q68_00041771 [Brassica cretica]
MSEENGAVEVGCLREREDEFVVAIDGGRERERGVASGRYRVKVESLKKSEKDKVWKIRKDEAGSILIGHFWVRTSNSVEVSAVTEEAFVVRAAETTEEEEEQMSEENGAVEVGCLREREDEFVVAIDGGRERERGVASGRYRVKVESLKKSEKDKVWKIRKDEAGSILIGHFWAWFESGVADPYAGANWGSKTVGSSMFSYSGAVSTEIPEQNNKLESTYLYIQMEYCPRTLRQVFESYNHFDKDFAWHLIRQIVEGLAHIHGQGIIHRDFTPNNIFFDARNDVKIGDFGLAKFLKLEQLDQDGGFSTDVAGSGVDSTGQAGTYFYTAPEIEQSWPKIDEKADMYSLGVVFFELWHPFGTAMERHVILTNLKLKGELPLKWVNEFPEQASLLRRLLSPSPSNRPSATELLRHAFPPRMESELLDRSSMFSYSGAVSTEIPEQNNKLESTYLYIQMEYCPRTLRQVFESYNHFDKDFAWHLIRQIVEGLAHIHGQGIIHRDFTPNNIFFDARNDVKIGDFGLAKFLKLEQLDQDGGFSTDVAGSGVDSTGQAGTYFYTAPEIEQSWPKIDEKADMYSLGVVFFELWHPFGTAMERHALDELSNLLTYLRVWRIEEHVHIDPLMPPTESYHRNLFFQVFLTKENSTGTSNDGVLLGVGGRYDDLVHQVCDREYKMNLPGAVGVSLALETMFQHLPMDLRPVRNEVNTSVLVCSRGGGGLLVQRMELVAELWEKSIKAEFLPTPDPSLTEQYEYANEHEIKCLVIITEPGVAQNQIEFVKVRHLELKKEKVVQREELVRFLLAAMAVQFRNPSVWS